MTPSALPLVSIVIPVYNGANYLRKAIDSALNQTYPNIEIIVVNDGSNDDEATHEIALSYEDKIRYYKKENGGVSSALNYGIKHMKGEYFSWLSHDDEHLPQKVEKQVEAVLKYNGKKPTICVCNYFLIDESGKELARSPHDIEKYFRISHKCFLGCETSFMIDGDATLISKRVFDECGMFNESLFASQETDMWLRSLEVAEFIFIPEYLVAYRCHTQQVTQKRAEAVGKEAGAYRGAVIKQASLQEIKNYFSTEKDAFRFGYSAYGYMYLFFYEAVHQIILKLHQLNDEGWELTHSALTGMFEHADVDIIYKVLTKISKSEKIKILVYCHEDNLLDRIIGLIMELRTNYEFVVVYCGRKRNDLPEEILFIHFGDTMTTYIAAYLTLLAELFAVNIFWINSSYFMQNTISINYLKDADICIIASFHYIEPKATMFNSNLKENTWQTPLSNASIITHEQHDQMFTQYIYPFESILMPTIDRSNDSYEKWNLLFHSILNEDISKIFPVINNLEDEDLSPIEVIQQLNNYLEKYEKCILETHRVYYEQSLYWRITKPLRVLSDLFRKIIRK